MTRTLRIPALFLLAAFLTLSSFAQERPLVGTVVEVDEGRGRLQLEADDQPGRVTIEIDSVSTTWNGFGTVIAGKPEIFKGSSGLANVRMGDRIEVRGAVRAEGIRHAAQIMLLGREVAVPQVGVGQTRPPTSVSTPTEAQARAAAVATVEGTIRQINVNEGRVMIQTAQRRMVTITAFRSTPVWYRGEEYRVANLEVGDRIRVEIDPRDAQADEMVARRIEVTQSVQDGDSPPEGGRVTTLDGRVTRTEPGLDYAYVHDGRTEVRVDMSRAEDANGEVIRARDLRTGDQLEISGSYNRVGDMFLASTVRFGSGERRPDEGSSFARYAVVTISGTVVETLEDASTIAIRDRDANQVVRVWAVDDLVVRTKANGYANANTLRVNDTVVVQAFRDQNGNLLAQTIRLRNR